MSRTANRLLGLGVWLLGFGAWNFWPQSHAAWQVMGAGSGIFFGLALADMELAGDSSREVEH